MVFRIAGPVWKDQCNHEAGSYVASFECLGENYDLYIYDHKSSYPSCTQHICIRYGDEPSYYHSPCGIIELALGAAGMECYQDALEILFADGVITWRSNKPTDRGYLP